MARLLTRLRRHFRLLVQVGFFAATNSGFWGAVRGGIYTGASKFVCVPGLNCYSCPGARLACPIGALQAVENSPHFSLPLYVAGLLAMFGAVLGRFVCGWLCPFGLAQDLLHKIPLKKKLKVLPGDRYLRHLKYVVLAVFVVLLPMLAANFAGVGDPWFCKYICPSGTLFAGVPLLIADPALRGAAGWLFVWKLLLLVALVVLSIKAFRPFCRYICPLGAIYGLFNPIALYRYRVDRAKCVGCGACSAACGFGIKVHVQPNSAECIRCGDCIKACPCGAISHTFSGRAGVGRPGVDRGCRKGV